MYKFDLHVHTKYSGDSRAELSDILRVVKEKGIDYVAITDHNTTKGWKELNSSSIIPGIEISSKSGHILGLFIKEKVKKGLSAEETVKRIHEQGGLAIAPHPFNFLRNRLGKKILELNLDGIEVFNSKFSILDYLNPRLKLAKDFKGVKVAGSDAHFPSDIGKALVASKYKPRKAIEKGEVKIIRKNRVGSIKNIKNIFLKILK